MVALTVNINDPNLKKREKQIFARTYKTPVTREKQLRAKVMAQHIFLQQYPKWEEIKPMLKPHYVRTLEYRFGLIPEVDRILSFPDIAKIFNLDLDCAHSYYNYAMRDLNAFSAKLDKLEQLNLPI